MVYLPLRLIFSLLLLGCFSGCATHRLAATDYPRTASYAIPFAENTSLRRVLTPLERRHPGQSGFLLIPNGRDAFLMRIAMIEAAEKTIDLQYYSIRDDETGQLLLEALLEAADRGVRVRVLVDDLNIAGADKTLSVLNQHPHIEVRVFNPFATEEDPLSVRLANAVTDLGHFLRRMHNKAFIVDNQVAVVGGRNLSDEYFGFSPDYNFHDLDTLAGGPVVVSVSHSYDTYWNSDEAYPISVMHPPMLESVKLAALRADLQKHWQSEKKAGELRHLIPLAQQIEKKKVTLLWARAELAADSPAKIDTPPADTRSKPEARIDRLADKSRREFIIVTPYFIPGDDGLRWLASLAQSGVRVRVLTNSLASTDVVTVHAWYRGYREALLKAGIELYEIKPLAGLSHKHRWFRSGSRAGLHSKVYVVDRRNVVLGSFNFDPRSEYLNTEMALVIHSPELAGQVVRLFDRITSPAASYRVILRNGHLAWVSEQNGRLVTQDDDPDADLWRRIKADLFSLLPIEGQL